MSQMTAIENLVNALEPGKKAFFELGVRSRTDANELAFLSEQPAPGASLNRHAGGGDRVGPEKAVEISDFDALHGRPVAFAGPNADNRRAFDDIGPAPGHTAARQRIGIDRNQAHV